MVLLRVGKVPGEIDIASWQYLIPSCHNATLQLIIPCTSCSPLYKSPVILGTLVYQSEWDEHADSLYYEVLR
jgi:hypothetical protein